MAYKDKEKQKQAQRDYYYRMKAAGRPQSTGRKNNQKKMQALKDNQPCTDCKVRYSYYVMQYDHIGTDKTLAVSRLIARASWARVLEEIAKCELVCSNCHAERTHQRMIKEQCMVS